MSSAATANLLSLEYRDVSFLHAAPMSAESQTPIEAGVPEHEVERRITMAREAATAMAEYQSRAENQLRHAEAQQRLTQTLEAFDRERATYFGRVEGEVVQLALSIARKILQRESELDPTLLAALVRIALDRMQANSEVRIRVVPSEVELWRTLAAEPGGAPRWQVEEDVSLTPGDCLVKTDLGEANFGLEAQLCDVEQSFRGLLAHKPGAR